MGRGTFGGGKNLLAERHLLCPFIGIRGFSFSFFICQEAYACAIVELDPDNLSPFGLQTMALLTLGPDSSVGWGCCVRGRVLSGVPGPRPPADSASPVFTNKKCIWMLPSVLRGRGENHWPRRLIQASTVGRAAR